MSERKTNAEAKQECVWCGAFFVSKQYNKAACSPKCNQHIKNERRKALKKSNAVDYIDGEIWFDIKGFEGMYAFSNRNRVKGLKRVSERNNSDMVIQERIIKPVLDKSTGYLKVVLSKNNKKTKFYIHRLVGEYILGNPTNEECINHKNGIKTDNNPENLEWCSIAENNIHAFKTGLQKKGKEHHLYGKKGDLCHNHKDYKPIIEEPKPIY